jgi:hypothetical protein
MEKTCLIGGTMAGIVSGCTFGYISYSIMISGTMRGHKRKFIGCMLAGVTGGGLIGAVSGKLFYIGISLVYQWIYRDKK